MLIGVFIAYMIVVLIVGFYAAKFSKNVEGYFIADRGLGAWVTSISSVANSESGWLILGAVGFAYTIGASAVWVAVGCLGGFFFNWYFYALRIRRYTGKLDSITVPDYLESRTEDNTRMVRLVALVIILVLMFVYAAAQMSAAGKAFRGLLGIRYEWGVLLGAVVTIAYVTAGGIRGDSWTDLVQGLLMVGALIVVPIIAIVHIGGVGELFDRLEQQQPVTYATFRGEVGGEWKILRIQPGKVFSLEEKKSVPEKEFWWHGWYLHARRKFSEGTDIDVYLAHAAVDEVSAKVHVNGEEKAPGGEYCLAEGDTLTCDGSCTVSFDSKTELKGGADLVSTMGGRPGLVFIGFLLGMLGIGLGYPGVPYIVNRYMAAKGPKEIARGKVVALTWGVLAFYGALAMGLCARVIFPDIEDPEQGILSAAKMFLHPALAGLILAAVISAIRSTADSQLLVAASSVTRDFYEKTLDKHVSDKKLLTMSRLTVVVVGVAATLLALAQVRVIFWFVLFAWGGLGAAFGPPLIVSVYWKRLTRTGALAGMLTGFVVTLVWWLWIRSALQAATGFDLYELFPGFIGALVATVVVSLFTAQPKEAQKYVDELNKPWYEEQGEQTPQSE